MYWAKKIASGRHSLRRSTSTALYLNDKYSLDGATRTASWAAPGASWARTTWAGRSARPSARSATWKPKRWKRKFDVAAYVAAWPKTPQRPWPPSRGRRRKGPVASVPPLPEVCARRVRLKSQGRRILRCDYDVVQRTLLVTSGREFSLRAARAAGVLGLRVRGRRCAASSRRVGAEA